MPALASSTGQRSLVWLVLAGSTLAGVFFLARTPLDTFWITDGGNRFLQIHSMERSGQLVAYDWPGAELDPELRFFPRANHHFHVLEAGAERDRPEARSLYSPWFALLSRAPYRLFGEPGLYVLPILGALLAAGGLVLLLRRLGVPGLAALGVALLLLASPLGFYALELWEHSLAVGITILGLLALQSAHERGSGLAVFGAGLLLGATIFLREEGYFLLLAVGLAGLCLRWSWRELASVTSGAIVGVLPLWLFNLAVDGHPLGLHAQVYEEQTRSGDGGPLGRVLTELVDAWHYLFRYHADPPIAAAIGLPILALLVAGLGGAPLRWRRGLLVLATVTTTFGALFAWLDPASVLGTLVRQSLFPGFPLLLLWLYGLPDQLRPDAAVDPTARDRLRWWTLTTLLFSLLLVVPLHRGALGILFGPRHHLVALVPGLALALWTLHRHLETRPEWRRGLLACTVLLAVSSLLVELRGLDDLHRKRSATARQAQDLAELSDGHIASNVFWLPEEMASLGNQATFFEFSGIDELDQLRRLLSEHGVSRVLVVLSPLFGRLEAEQVEFLRREAIRESFIRAAPSAEGSKLAHMDLLALLVPTGSR